MKSEALDLNLLPRVRMGNPSACPSLSVVIPAYNEERRLPGTLQSILGYLARQSYASEVIVVDDGSHDGTSRIVESLGGRYPGVKLIRNDHRGKGYAVRTGVAAARGTIILLFDADSSTPIQDVEKLLPWFDDGYEIVVGSREGSGAKRIREPFHRHLMGRVFNLVVRLLLVRGIADTQCGFKALRGHVAHNIFARVRLYGDDARRVTGAMVTAYDVEVLFLGQKLGHRIKQIPVEWRYGAESKVNPLTDSWHNFRDVVRVRWNDWCGRYDGK
jgi:dolichyl-phosphate beta-glucosyltransferase